MKQNGRKKKMLTVIKRPTNVKAFNISTLKRIEYDLSLKATTRTQFVKGIKKKNQLNFIKI